jgi:DNA-binding MarR family transcriptional regulator
MIVRLANYSPGPMPDRDLPTLALELGRLLRRASCGTKDSLGPLFQLALLAIKDRDRLTMREFADALRVSPSTATACVDRMVKKGVVRRQVDPGNRRRTLLHLTPRGAAILAAHAAEKRAAFAAIFDVLSTADRRDLARLFTTLLDRHHP